MRAKRPLRMTMATPVLALLVVPGPAQATSPTCPGGVLPCGQFTLPNLGKEGNETPNQFRNPGYADTDFSVKKVTQIRESINFEFRVDFFNLFNRVNLVQSGSNGGLDTNLQDGGFGQITATYPPRNILLGARLNF